LSSRASFDLFQISHYNLYSCFRSKYEVCAYCNTNFPMDFESSDFDVLWLKINLSTITVFSPKCKDTSEIWIYEASWTLWNCKIVVNNNRKAYGKSGHTGVCNYVTA
ncbi:hypothetical protein SK128_010914, partial [Halocaridina rubra]